LGKLQREDAKLATVIPELEKGEQFSRYYLDKGVLYSKSGRRSLPKLVLTEAAVSMVFTYFHESPVGGHLGVSKTIRKLHTYFVWDAIDKDIRRKFDVCHICG
jgi:hypothetical protein